MPAVVGCVVVDIVVDVETASRSMMVQD